MRECVCEVPLCLGKVTSLESVVLGRAEGACVSSALLSLPCPSAFPLVPSRQRERLQRRWEELRELQSLETHCLPSSVHCLLNLTSLSLVNFRGSSLPLSVGGLRKLSSLSLRNCPGAGGYRAGDLFAARALPPPAV